MIVHDIMYNTFLHFATYPEYGLGHPTSEHTKAENQQHTAALSYTHTSLHFPQMLSPCWFLTHTLSGPVRSFWRGMLTHLNTSKHLTLFVFLFVFEM